MYEKKSNSQIKSLEQKDINRLLTFSTLPKTYLGHIKKEKIKDQKKFHIIKNKIT